MTPDAALPNDPPAGSTVPATSDPDLRTVAIERSAPRHQPVWLASLAGVSGLARVCAALLAGGWVADVVIDSLSHDDEHVTISATVVVVLAVLVATVAAAEGMTELRRRRYDRIVASRQDPLVQAWLRRPSAHDRAGAGWLPWAEPEGSQVRLLLLHAQPDAALEHVTFTIERQELVAVDDLDSTTLGDLRADYEEAALELEHRAYLSTSAAALITKGAREEHARVQVDLDGALEVLRDTPTSEKTR